MELTLVHAEAVLVVVPTGTDFRAPTLGTTFDVKESTFSSILTIGDVCGIELVEACFIFEPLLTDSCENGIHFDLVVT